MNAPTGRKASVIVMERAISASVFPKLAPMDDSVMTTRKKSNASRVQPRKLAVKAAPWPEPAAREASPEVGVKQMILPDRGKRLSTIRAVFSVSDSAAPHASAPGARAGYASH